MDTRTPEEAREGVRVASACWEQALVDIAEELGGMATVNAIRAAGIARSADFRWSNVNAMKVMNYLYPEIGGYVMERTEDLMGEHYAQQANP